MGGDKLEHYIQIFESDIDKWYKVKELLGQGNVLSQYDAIVVGSLLEGYITLREELAECTKALDP